MKRVLATYFGGDVLANAGGSWRPSVVVVEVEAKSPIVPVAGAFSMVPVIVACFAMAVYSPAVIVLKPELIPKSEVGAGLK